MNNSRSDVLHLSAITKLPGLLCLVVISLVLASCYSHRVRVPDERIATEPRQATTYSFWWGIRQNPIEHSAENCKSNAFAEVTSKTTFLDTIVTLVTLGIVSRTTWEWTCAKNFREVEKIGSQTNRSDVQDLVFEDDREIWVNYHQTEDPKIEGLIDVWNDPAAESGLAAYRSSTQTIQAILARAEEQRVATRGIGGGWSWTPVGVSDGFILNTKPLNLKFTLDPSSLVPASMIESKYLIFAQAGTLIDELNDYLEANGLSLMTSGASNGQSIAGAVSTGTHGAALDIGGMPEFVRGIHLITGPDEHLYLERASAPVGGAALARQLEAKYVADDELFNAALVSFGSFGVIHGMLLEVEDAYKLKVYRFSTAWDGELRELIGNLDFSNYGELPIPFQKPHHFEILINPFKVSPSDASSDKEEQVFVTIMYKVPESTPGFTCKKTCEGPNKSGFGDGTGKAAAALDFPPVRNLAFPLIASSQIGADFDEFSQDLKPKEIRTRGEVFGNTTTRGPTASLAIAVKAEDAVTVVDKILKLNEECGPYPIAVPVRFLAGSSATLGFTQYSPTAVVELDGILSGSAEEIHSKLTSELRDSEIPHSYHWGKLHLSDENGLRASYGERVDRWLTARNRLLNENSRKIFSSNYFSCLGLTVERFGPSKVNCDQYTKIGSN